jgi:hypothetical protein
MIEVGRWVNPSLNFSAHSASDEAGTAKASTVDTGGDMIMTSPADDLSDVRSFWETVELWPMRYERWCADRWPYLILVPYLLLAIYGFAFVVLERRMPSDLSGSYELLSLGIALLVSGAFFKRWEPQFRDALGSLFARGSVEDTPPDHYLEFSKEQASWFSSPWRLLPILSCVAFTSAVNWIVGLEMLRGSTFNAPRPYLVLFGATMAIYSVGLVLRRRSRSVVLLRGRSNAMVPVRPGSPSTRILRTSGQLRRSAPAWRCEPRNDLSIVSGMRPAGYVGVAWRFSVWAQFVSERIRAALRQVVRSGDSCRIGCSHRPYRRTVLWTAVEDSLPHGRSSPGVRKRVWSPTRSTPAQQRRNGS